MDNEVCILLTSKYILTKLSERLGSGSVLKVLSAHIEARGGIVSVTTVLGGRWVQSRDRCSPGVHCQLD